MRDTRIPLRADYSFLCLHHTPGSTMSFLLSLLGLSFTTGGGGTAGGGSTAPAGEILD